MSAPTVRSSAIPTPSRVAAVGGIGAAEVAASAITIPATVAALARIRRTHAGELRDLLADYGGPETSWTGTLTPAQVRRMAGRSLHVSLERGWDMGGMTVDEGALIRG